MTSFLERGHRLQQTKTFAKAGLLTVWLAAGVIGAAVLVVAWVVS